MLHIVEALRRGTRYNQVEEKLEVSEEKAEEVKEKEEDEITMEVLKDIANLININIQVEVYFPSKHEDIMMPI